MKTILDFKLVPLDKWVDLYNACDPEAGSQFVYINNAWKDVTRLAQTQVKDENDLNRELAEAAADYMNSSFDSRKFGRLQDATNARNEFLGIKFEVEEAAPVPEPGGKKHTPLEELIK